MGGHSLASDSSPLHPWDRGEGGTLQMNYPTLLGGISLPQDYSPLLSGGGVHLIPRVENYSPKIISLSQGWKITQKIIPPPNCDIHKISTVQFGTDCRKAEGRSGTDWDNLWKSRGGSQVNLCPRAVPRVLNLPLGVD